ncbi:MAG: hypothetical protein AAGM22_12860 [Acidobacteriota bacterium]
MNRRFAAWVLLAAALVLVWIALGPRSHVPGGGSAAAADGGKPGVADVEGRASPADQAPAGGATADAADDPARAAAREERFARVVASMWWHQPRFAESSTLALRADQTSRMDALCLGTLRRRLELQRQVRTGQPALRASIEGLDLEHAQAGLEALEAAAGELAMIETALAVEVLSVLDPSQREVLRRDHPVLLKRPWLKTLGGERLRGPSGRPASGRPAPGRPGG